MCPLRIVSLRVDRVRAGDLPFLSDAIEAFRRDYGRVPSQQEGLDALLHPPDQYHGPYMRRLVPNDPWGSNYIYRPSPGGDTFTLYSSGRNRVDEHGDGDDVISGPKKYTCEEYGVGCFRPCETAQVAALAGSVLLGALLASYGVGVLGRRLWQQWGPRAAA